jgi:peptide deformylase
MLLKLYQAGQPVLRKTAKHVTKKQLELQHTQDVIDFMIATLRDAPGVGLAAPQVGEPMQIIIIDDKAAYQEPLPPAVLKEQGRKPIALKVLVNPVLEIVDPETALFFEGCLSVDGYGAAVERAKAVRVTALDRKGNEVSYVAHGWHARILQHEADHLQGTLYIDKMKPKSFMTTKILSLKWRKALQADISKAFK